MSGIRALVALESGVNPEAVRAALPPDDIEVVEWLEGAAKRTGETTADLAIVACSANSGSAISMIERAAKLVSGKPVVVLQLEGAHSNGYMHQVFAAGADDIIVLPETPEHIRHALQKAIARKRGSIHADGAAPASLVCLLGPKGGTGKTVTACNLSVALAEKGQRVSLVDLDLQFGDVGLGLNLKPEQSIYALARAGGTLDAEKVDDYLIEHESGVRVLLAPFRPDQAGAIQPEFIVEVLALLRSVSDFVVVDTPAGFSRDVIAAVDSSTDICVIGTLDMFSLKDTKLGLETLTRMGYADDSIRVILNRSDSHVGIGKNDVAWILGREPDLLIPSDRDIPRSVTKGNPIVSAQPRSAAAKAFRALADLYVNAPTREAADAPSPAAPPRVRKTLLRKA